MSKYIPATPIVTGADADRILHELEFGTPDTPQRIETIKRADKLYAKVIKKMLP